MSGGASSGGASSGGLREGHRLAGRYTLGARIGAGGMGQLWRATQDALGREVAIKLILGAELAGEEAQARFRREAALAAQVEHRNVVDIIDYGTTEGGAQFLVMPLLRGRSLHAAMEAPSPPTIAALVGWLDGVLSGLAAIHAQGVVHRDLKPANVFLASDADGVVVPKVLDFGISRGAGHKDLTQLGAAMGTPEFMAPEQFESTRDVDARADLFSVGAILYRAVCGRPPYEGADAFAVFRATLETTPPAVASLRPEVPAELAAVVERAIAKRPDDRFDDARGLKDALSGLDLAGLEALPLAAPSATALGVAPTTPAAAALGGTALLDPADRPSGVARTVHLEDGDRSSGVARTAHLGAGDRPSGVARTAHLGAGDRESVGTTRVAEGERPSAAPGARRLGFVVGGLGLALALAAGVGWLVGSGEPEARLEPAVDPSPPSSPEPAAPIEPPSGLRLAAVGPLAELAMRWAQLAPTERPAELRFVADGEGYAPVVPSELPQPEAERLATAFGGRPEAGVWDPSAGLTPALMQTRVRLNVHTEPSTDAPTSRVLAHDTMVVALHGAHEGATSAPAEDGDQLAFFVASRAHAGWALARYLAPSVGCLPTSGALAERSELDPGALARDLTAARTHATLAGIRRPLWLLVARDRASVRSEVGLFATGTGCAVGARLAGRTVRGVIDEVFFSETAPGGDTLLLVSVAATDPPPPDGMLEWSAFDPVAAERVWSELVPTAPYLSRARRGAVSGRRDRVMRSDDAHALAVRRPGAPRVFYRWDDEAGLVADVPEEAGGSEGDEEGDSEAEGESAEP